MHLFKIIFRIPNVFAKTPCDTWGYSDEILSTTWFVVPKGRGVTVYIRGGYVTLY